MPETHQTMKALLGRVPYDVDVGERTVAVIKDAVAGGHLRKTSQLVKHGLTKDSYEQLREALMPAIQGWEKRYTKKEIAGYADRVGAAEKLIASSTPQL